ncbi:MAG TPA: biliverdin-producing heme oxygenase [Kofleriaceae bacterium]|jgi:heme oxygenase
MLQEAISRSSSLMARLNAATTSLHDDRELFAGRVSWLDYRLYLVRLYGFHAAVEAALTAFRPLATVVADAALRNHKTALLAADLVALGMDRRDLAQVPRMVFAVPRALPEALGWTYVVESATLRGKLLARRLARQLPDEIQRASAYLGCYGDEAVTRWRELGDAIDAFALRLEAQAERAAERGASATELDCARVIEAARDGAIQLRCWVGPVLQPRTTRRHA